MASKLRHHEATGDVTTETTALKSVACTGDGAAGSVVVREGGSGGTIRLTLRAASGSTVVWTASDPNGVVFSDGIHVTISGAEVSLEIE